MRIDRSLLNWGVFLIALGGVPLAVQQGWAESTIAGDLWRLWPLILVGIGLGLILRWTPMAWLGGALVSLTFGVIFGALIAGGVQGVSSACVSPGSGETSTSSESGLGSPTGFSLELELSCGDLAVSRGSADEWTVEASHGVDAAPTITGSSTELRVDQGDTAAQLFAFTQQTRSDWNVTLPADSPLSASVTLNAAAGTVDLGAGPLESLSTTLNMSDLALDLGAVTTAETAGLSLTLNASSADLTLPAVALRGSVTLNASSLEMCLPADAEARFEIESTFGSHDFADSGLENAAEGWETPGYDTAASRVEVSITSTVSSVSLQRPEVCP